MLCGLVWEAGLTWLSPDLPAKSRGRVLRLRTFGGLELVADGDHLAGAALQPRRLAVLAALAVAGPHGLSRDKLLGLLWPETSEARGRQAGYELEDWLQAEEKIRRTQEGIE